MRVLVSFRDASRVEPYFEALQAAGLEPVASTPSIRSSWSDVRGLLLTGGSDIVPSYFGQAEDPQLGPVDAERDAFELGLLSLADAVDLPVLCICRGMQLLNVHRGGTLVQHLQESPRHRRNDSPKPEAVHGITVEPGSRLAKILGMTDARVNSRHHQAVDRLGTGLAITARDPEDGVIEAVEDPSRRFLLGVQWHPEDQAPVDEVQRRLFDAFAAAVR